MHSWSLKGIQRIRLSLSPNKDMSTCNFFVNSIYRLDNSCYCLITHMIFILPLKLFQELAQSNSTLKMTSCAYNACNIFSLAKSDIFQRQEVTSLLKKKNRSRCCISEKFSESRKSPGYLFSLFFPLTSVLLMLARFLASAAVWKRGRESFGGKY